MNAKSFVDTNVLVYAYDTSIGDKHKTAVALLDKLWREQSGILSQQVLHEFCSILMKKFHLGPVATAKLVEPYTAWEIVGTSAESLLAALKLQEHHQFAFWDALILQAALDGGADILYSEDLSHGQKVKSLTIINPFKPA